MAQQRRLLQSNDTSVDGSFNNEDGDYEDELFTSMRQIEVSQTPKRTHKSPNRGVTRSSLTLDAQLGIQLFMSAMVNVNPYGIEVFSK